MTSGDVAKIDEVLSTASFDDLCQRWKAFVNSLDRYNFSIYDYDNDIDVREQLEEALSKCAVDVRTRALAALIESDLNFVNRTNPTERSRYGPNGWHSRLPQSPGQALAEDIKSGNL